MANSAAESFIIMNSIFFGVSDIGISTVVQQAAFYSLIIQGIFYLIVPPGTLIDWWIITRETVFIMFYLVVLTYCLYGNRVELGKAFLLFLLYIIHIVLMKFSAKYEVAIKQALANRMEGKELARIAKKDINKYHCSVGTKAISIEMLNKVRFKLKNNYIVLADTGIKKKMKYPACIKTGEEKFAERDDIALTARKIWKEACQ
jgi:Ca2+/Na+ antiporter